MSTATSKASSLLAKLREALSPTKVEADDAERWRNLVAAVADGKATFEVAASELSSLGRSIEDLEGDVGLLLRRREWAAALASEKPAQQRMNQLDAAIKSVNAEVDAYVEKAKKRIAELREQSLAAERDYSAAGSAMRELSRTAPRLYPDVQTRIEELNTQGRDLVQRIRAAEEEVSPEPSRSNCVSKLASIRRQIEQRHKERRDVSEQLRNQEKHYQREVEIAERRLAELRKQFQGIRAELDQLQGQLLQP